jgi:hypothetical protein
MLCPDGITATIKKAAHVTEQILPTIVWLDEAEALAYTRASVGFI